MDRRLGQVVLDTMKKVRSHKHSQLCSQLHPPAAPASCTHQLHRPAAQPVASFFSEVEYQQRAQRECIVGVMFLCTLEVPATLDSYFLFFSGAFSHGTARSFLGTVRFYSREQAMSFFSGQRSRDANAIHAGVGLQICRFTPNRQRKASVFVRSWPR